jgi:dsRNA-specific ribonuclease
LNASYPHLPTRVLKAATNAYVGHQTCANVALEIGVGPLIRWHRKVRFFDEFNRVIVIEDFCSLRLR